MTVVVSLSGRVCYRPVGGLRRRGAARVRRARTVARCVSVLLRRPSGRLRFLPGCRRFWRHKPPVPSHRGVGLTRRAPRSAGLTQAERRGIIREPMPEAANHPRGCRLRCCFRDAFARRRSSHGRGEYSITRSGGSFTADGKHPCAATDAPLGDCCLKTESPLRIRETTTGSPKKELKRDGGK